MIEGVYVNFLSEIKEPRISEPGGKGYSLAVLLNNGFNVPKGFIITSYPFYNLLYPSTITLQSP
ncbi:MAG: hypothetical protein QXO15_06850 [Nitrososphaerota archaeon]